MPSINRRRFITLAGGGAIAVPMSVIMRSSHAADMPMVEETEPQAQALKYVAVSTQVGQTCANCVLYQGDADTEAAACTIFAGKHVAGAGWCSAWAAKG